MNHSVTPIFSVFLLSPLPDHLTALSCQITQNFKGKSKVFYSANVPQAYFQVIRRAPSAIVCQCCPETEGAISQLCLNLKQTKATCFTPTIVYTNQSNSQGQLRALASGADAFLAAPFSAESLALQIINLLKLRKYAPTENAPEGTWSTLSSFLQAIEFLLDQQVDLPDGPIETLTHKLGVSRTQLHNKIKQASGMSTTAYIRSYRLKKARNLLLNPHLSVSEIAYQVGFNSLSYFTNCFHKHFGQSPSQLKASSS